MEDQDTRDYLAMAQSGMTSATGEIGRQVDVGGWLRPTSVEITDEYVIPVWSEETVPMTWQDVEAAQVRSHQSLLADWLEIAREPYQPKALRTFVERWGVPEICQHGLPDAHTGPVITDPDLVATGCEPVMVDGRGAVRVSDVLHWARQTRADLVLAAELRARRETRGRSKQTAADEDLQLTELAAAVDRLMAWCGVRPHFVWWRAVEAPKLRLQAWGPLGAVALQMALALTQTHALAMCDGCGVPFVPSQVRRGDRRSWCQACGLKAAQREASRRYRERKRDERAKGDRDGAEE
jgi:hypothetical protein